MKKTILLIILGILTHSGHAQRETSLQELLDSALNKNADLQKIQLDIEKAKKLNHPYNGIGATNVSYTYGQIDGPDQDYQWQINQPLGNPISSLAQSKLREARVNNYQIEYELNKAWLQMQIEQAYAGWQAWYRIREINTSLKETYEQALLVAERQKDLGELSKTEVGFARGRYAEAMNQENQAYREALRYVYQLEVLTRTSLDNATPEPIYPLDMLAPPRGSAEGLIHRYYQSKLTVAEKNKTLSDSRFAPSFSVGYFNQQLQGIAGYDGFTLGAKIPLFNVSTYQNRQMASIDLAQSRVEVSQKLWQRQSKVQQLMRQKENLLTQLKDLNIDPSDIQEDLKIVRSSYQHGEIGMLVLSQSLNALSAAEISQLQLLLSLRQIQSEINYLITE